MNLKIIRISSSKKNHVLKKLCTVLRLTKIKFYIFINFLHFQGVISFNDFQNDNKKWLLKNRKSTRCWSWNDFSKAPKWCLAALLLVPHLKSCLKPKRVVWSFRDFRSKVFSVFMLCLHEFMWSCYWMRLSRFSSSFVFCSVCLTFHFFFLFVEQCRFLIMSSQKQKDRFNILRYAIMESHEYRRKIVKWNSR